MIKIVEWRVEAERKKQMRDCWNWKGPSRAAFDSDPILSHGLLVFGISGQREWSLVRELVSGRDGTRTQ